MTSHNLQTTNMSRLFIVSIQPFQCHYISACPIPQGLPATYSIQYTFIPPSIFVGTFPFSLQKKPANHPFFSHYFCSEISCGVYLQSGSLENVLEYFLRQSFHSNFDLIMVCLTQESNKLHFVRVLFCCFCLFVYHLEYVI